MRYVNGDKNAALLTEAIINMGHALGLQVAAEGVEDEQQHSFLKNKGCDVNQGYLTGRPMMAADLKQQYMKL